MQVTVVLELLARVLAGDVALLGVDEAFDIFQALFDGRVFGADLAGFEHSGQDDAGDADGLLAAPAAVLGLVRP